MRFQIVVLIAVAALAGCDRRDQKPMNTAAQSAPEARRVEPSGAPPPAATSPEPTAKAPRPDSQTQQEPPVQGQADARQAEQSQHFDNNKK